MMGRDEIIKETTLEEFIEKDKSIKLNLKVTDLNEIILDIIGNISSFIDLCLKLT